MAGSERVVRKRVHEAKRTPTAPKLPIHNLKCYTGFARETGCKTID
jgi:hypothetical protein